MEATIRYIREELKGLLSGTEITSITRMIFEALRGYSLTDMVVNREEILTTPEKARIREIISRLRNHEPIQYILGYTHFLGIPIRVNPSVLIPRPETEELADWIIREETSGSLRFTDICTGSGCIALALKKAFPASHVEGCDLSQEALSLARENAAANNLPVSFFQADILNWEKTTSWNFTDVIVSNPPYVLPGEKYRMLPHVLEQEPPLALFVPEEDPLVFYRRILEFARKWLNPGGKVYFEINEQFGRETERLLTGFGFSEVEIRPDLQGKQRMTRGTFIP